MELISFFTQMLFYNPIALGLIITAAAVFITRYIEYKNSTYYKVTKLSYFSVRYNTGRYGEYYTYKHLKHFEKDGAKFLFNVYVPKENNETTEIDVLMICKKGIFVFESKNYSGWIFGSEKQKNWYQTLPKGRGKSHKEAFYNPIMQNRSHIKHLKSYIDKEVYMKSIIVFSDRCTLKNVQVDSSDVSVINRRSVADVVFFSCDQNDVLTEAEVDEIYNKLFPLTQGNDFAKMQHVANIRNKQIFGNVQTVYKSPTPNTTHIHNDVQTEQMQDDKNDTKVTKDVPLQNDNGLICPRCNGKLVLRTATKGKNAGNQFYGCSNFPRCKYIRNIKNDL